MWQLTAGSAALGLALAAVAVTAAGPWDTGQRTAERARAAAPATGGAHHAPPPAPAAPRRPAPAPSAPGVLPALHAPAAAERPAGRPADLAATLVPLLADPGLGPLRTASVVDTATGTQLYGEGAGTPMTPASTVKIATVAAALSALARKQPASFEGAGKAVRDELAKLGLPLAGARFADGSGLDRRDRVSAALLTTLLTRAADPARPALRPVLTGLPVGGFTGTLAGRFDTAPATAGAGLVRAKTGTLTGVNTLAGTVVTADGRLLAFAFLAGRTLSPYEAQPALDRLSAALAGQG